MATSSRPYQAQSGAVVIGTKELEKLRKKFADVAADLTRDTELVEAMGHQQATSAVRRIRETKRSPAGRRWAPWSRGYAKTREPRHSLLVNTGHLADTMTYEVLSPSQVLVGSPMNYAGAHLHGVPKRNLPARPFLDTEPGFADSRDRQELRDILRAFWEEHGL